MRSRKHAQTRPSPVPVALVMIDVLTTFQSPDGDAVLEGAITMRDALVRLKKRAREASIPVLYVNDNFGDWRSEKEVLMGRCLEAKGAQFVRPLLPDSEDYFVLKPMHSAFYMTPLEVLLQHLEVCLRFLSWPVRVLTRWRTRRDGAQPPSTRHRERYRGSMR